METLMAAIMLWAPGLDPSEAIDWREGLALPPSLRHTEVRRRRCLCGVRLHHGRAMSHHGAEPPLRL